MAVQNLKRLACAMGAALACAGAASAAGDIASTCPGAAAWYAAHPNDTDEALAKRDAARSFTDPQLRAELAARAARDQAARLAMTKAARKDWGPKREVAAIDEENIKWLFELVRSKGFPSAAQVGEQGVRDAWLLALHADRAPKFQQQLVPVLDQRRVDGELSSSDMARFVDRLLVAGGKPQRFGTQGSDNWEGSHFGLASAEILRDVEENRRQFELMPLADYVCMTKEERSKR
ncbi:DUF6624 domain-containing protein [Massilia sp. IC2-476]|uniref:DUF6624 domain-containing protein n=1 Tax=Massilia sp. IC2-476 TaxID=2887199 RepID=UPI001D0FF204|nr:DUF6624 domain-containing protein [Massilia sp. IC2-476]MCC2971282.1 hypothetical protein [Massilia sp. IC2-476]